MICAGNSKNPMECKKEAVCVLSGFSMCEDHAREMVMVFNAAKAQQRMQSGYTKRPFIDSDLMNGKSLDLSKMIPEVKDGKWRNVKNIR